MASVSPPCDCGDEVEGHVSGVMGTVGFDWVGLMEGMGKEGGKEGWRGTEGGLL